MKIAIKKRLYIKRLALLVQLFCIIILISCDSGTKPAALVFQSDFGLKDGAVSAMKGVAFGVSSDLKMYDITHEIPPFNIWEASYRLVQTAPYWPAGTVFVSVVDPGVGTKRKSVVVKTKTGHFFVTPDNGTLTLVEDEMGIEEVREIDEAINRRQNSGESYTFHGRDVYAFTGARLAAKSIKFEEVGQKLPAEVFTLPYQKPKFEDGKVTGGIPILDIQYGNVWTNVDKATFEKLDIKTGENVKVQVFNKNEKVFDGQVVYVNTFGEVPEGSRVGYFNSLLKFSVAINMGNFSQQERVFSGSEWNIVLRK